MFVSTGSLSYVDVLGSDILRPTGCSFRVFCLLGIISRIKNFTSNCNYFKLLLKNLASSIRYSFTINLFSPSLNAPGIILQSILLHKILLLEHLPSCVPSSMTYLIHICFFMHLPLMTSGSCYL